jgi:hypothetical protein
MRRLLLVLALLALAAFAGWRLVERARRAPVVTASLADTSSTGVRAVRLYFGAPDGGLAVETRELPEVKGLHARVAALVAELDRGPTAGGVAVLPAGTAVLHVYLDDRGLLTLDLSRAFVQGFRGGSAAEHLAIASLVRTLAAELPQVTRVLIVAGGRPVATLGGHLPLDRPLDVSEWP